MKTLRIAMVSDFFFPNTGGVETHIYKVSQCLLERGHKVVVITHAYGDRKGVRWMANGLKVYYLPVAPFHQSATLPLVFFSLPLFRHILIRERIDLVHAHQAFSTLGHEALLNAGIMGLACCFTDHSLLGFSDASSIHMNKVLKLVLSSVDHVICVSNTSKENTVLRASLDPRLVSVIPNAIDSSQFLPSPASRPGNSRLNVVVVSRLTYRKGVDLLVGLLPLVCAEHPNVDFIIGGDGPKRALLEEVVERHGLSQRVELLGSLKHAEVPGVLARGHIFLNCSLTEAFCIAIVEAASCGLLAVSTAVGGVPEVLPGDMIELGQPSVKAMASALSRAISRVGQIDPLAFHERVEQMYNWRNVATRNEVVYRKVVQGRGASFLDRLGRYYHCGVWAGKVWCIIVVAYFFTWKLIDYLYPAESIESAMDWPSIQNANDRIVNYEKKNRKKKNTQNVNLI